VKQFRIVLRLSRFCLAYFVGNTSYAVVVFFVIPLPLGLATRAFFDGLSGASAAGLNAWSAIAAIVALQLAEALAGPALGSPWSPLQLKCQVLLQRNLFLGVLRGYGRHGLPVATGEAISRFRDDPVEIADALDALSDLIGRSLFAIVAAIVMAQINATMAALVLIPLFLTSFLAELLDRQISSYRAAAREASGRVAAFLSEILASQLAFKVAGTTAAALARFAALGEERRRTDVREAVLDQTMNALNLNLVHLGTGIVLLLGAQDVNQAASPDQTPFTIGDLALFVIYLDGLTWYPAEVGRIIADLKRLRVSLDRMQAVVPGEPPDAVATPAPVHLHGPFPAATAPREREPLARLEVRGLTCTHASGARGIADVSFSFERGAFTVIAGRVGAGKSTLLRALLGLLPRDGGAIFWNGRAIADPGAFFVPPRAAYTAQAPRLFSDTLRANLLLGRPDDAEALARAIHAAVLERDVAGLDHGLDTPIGTRGVKLSGGQIQRAAAARMFLREAEFLVVDDLSSALDAETEAELWSRLFARGREVTCLAVSNRPTALRRADQILLMAEGRLIDRGRLEDLLLGSAEMRHLWAEEGATPSGSGDGAPR